MADQERLARWTESWASGVYKNWHRTDKNPDLWKFLHLLCTDESDKNGLFLIPMCGKCVDLKFLYEDGFNVLGVEFCENVVQDFFAESSLAFQVSAYSDSIRIYSTLDQRLRVVCGDFFALTKEVLGKVPVHMIWDRGSFGSIAKEDRKKYAQVMKELLQGTEVRYLLDCWQYDDWYRSFPPLNTPVDMIQELFGDCFHIKELQRTENQERASDFGVATAFKLVYLMTGKP